ncbi:hypothetical protein GOQ27_08395 [Clostridium sp. D2Q-11]|uniref:Uncharacterized protein n=1 Tax=Anaeromonas frigoriresistens TaxID=2683708 RepID=A0A942UZL9_9FIRM|nr:hypothetical protein [Anaeromonas frigoriresistens]MBS4538482.1 hypothetical protein [Anaeromonas frigoriresistens]
MFLRFIKNCTDKEVDLEEAQVLLAEVSEELKDKHKDMNARLLDYQIWKYMTNG